MNLHAAKSLFLVKFVLAIGCFSLFSCSFQNQNSLIGEWYIKHRPKNSVMLEQEHMILRLYPQGVYTRYGSRGSGYSIGRWTENEQGGYIRLLQESGTMTQKEEFLRIEEKNLEVMSAGLFKKMPFNLQDRQIVLDFQKVNNHSDSDPYQPDLQKWRVAPKKPESETAIRKRVVDYLNFLKNLYQHALDNDLQVMTTDWYPAPLRMQYGNIVRMAYSNELDDWYTCFYDSAQAVKGYQVISGPIQDITLKKGVNTFERNLDCVEQLLKQLEE